MVKNTKEVNKDTKLKKCPFCGSEDITMGAFNISCECYICCNGCGAFIETEVPWDKMSVEEHDEKCREKLTELWNRRCDKT